MPGAAAKLVSDTPPKWINGSEGRGFIQFEPTSKRTCVLAFTITPTKHPDNPNPGQTYMFLDIMGVLFFRGR